MNVNNTCTKYDDLECVACVMKHMLATDNWSHGNPTKCWEDETGVLCIQYESGSWWHYQKDGSTITWW